MLTESLAENKLSKSDDVIPSVDDRVGADDDGRSYSGGTFNRPWSADEQKQLEALLLKHPSERFESRRWAKIARELGNRTPQQVGWGQISSSMYVHVGVDFGGNPGMCPWSN